MINNNDEIYKALIKEAIKLLFNTIMKSKFLKYEETTKDNKWMPNMIHDDIILSKKENVLNLWFNDYSKSFWFGLKYNDDDKYFLDEKYACDIIEHMNTLLVGYTQISVINIVKELIKEIEIKGIDHEINYDNYYDMLVTKLKDDTEIKTIKKKPGRKRES